MNVEWIKEQFAEHKAMGENRCEDGIVIKEIDIL